MKKTIPKKPGRVTAGKRLTDNRNLCENRKSVQIDIQSENNGNRSPSSLFSSFSLTQVISVVSIVSLVGLYCKREELHDSL